MTNESFHSLLHPQESPFEHRSHMAWGALKHENRLLLAAGSAVTASPVRALLELEPLDITTLLALVGPEAKAGEGKRSGWYSGGAYCEAVMRQRMFAFMVAYGRGEGQRLWREWYLDCKRRGGEGHDASIHSSSPPIFHHHLLLLL
jgi:hypothetical protein